MVIRHFFCTFAPEMHKSIIIASLLLLSLTVMGVPATPKPIVYLAEDGNTDTIYLHGDEFSSYRISSKKKKPQIDISGFHAPQRTMLQSYMPSRGVVRVPVLLVNFADYSFTIENPIEKFEDYFNGKGGSNPHATGSVHDYYIASSDSALDLRYEVVGIYTLSQNMVCTPQLPLW